jgi:hypothetical protein
MYIISKNRLKAFVVTNLIYKIKVIKHKLVVFPASIQIEISDQSNKKLIFQSLTKLELFGFTKLQ